MMVSILVEVEGFDLRLELELTLIQTKAHRKELTGSALVLLVHGRVHTCNAGEPEMSESHRFSASHAHNIAKNQCAAYKSWQ